MRFYAFTLSRVFRGECLGADTERGPAADASPGRRSGSRQVRVGAGRCGWEPAGAGGGAGFVRRGCAPDRLGAIWVGIITFRSSRIPGGFTKDNEITEEIGSETEKNQTHVR